MNFVSKGFPCLPVHEHHIPDELRLKMCEIEVCDNNCEYRIKGIISSGLSLEGIAEGIKVGKAEGRAEGIEVGKAEGREEGRTQERLENIRFMLSIGVDPEIISNKFDIPVEEILKL